jgi:hypothetical protein
VYKGECEGWCPEKHFDNEGKCDAYDKKCWLCSDSKKCDWCSEVKYLYKYKCLRKSPKKHYKHTGKGVCIAWKLVIMEEAAKLVKKNVLN